MQNSINLKFFQTLVHLVLVQCDFSVSIAFQLAFSSKAKVCLEVQKIENIGFRVSTIKYYHT